MRLSLGGTFERRDEQARFLRNVATFSGTRYNTQHQNFWTPLVSQSRSTERIVIMCGTGKFNKILWSHSIRVKIAQTERTVYMKTYKSFGEQLRLK